MISFFDVCNSNNGQRTPAFYGARCAEELLRMLDRNRIQHLAAHHIGGREFRVPSSRQMNERIDEKNDVLTVLNQTFGLFKGDLGDLHMSNRRFVDGRTDHFAARLFQLAFRSVHVFRTLVEEKPQDVRFRIIV